MASDLTVVGGFAAATVVASLFIKYRNWRALPVPPGPKPWPFVGNITDLRPLELWVAAREWSQQYGKCLLDISTCVQRTMCPLRLDFTGA